jgi:hypothetical protein
MEMELVFFRSLRLGCKSKDRVRGVPMKLGLIEPLILGVVPILDAGASLFSMDDWGMLIP